MSTNFTINDLKKHLGPGLGLRKNKYLLEIPVPGVEGAKINVLARSAGFPERNITTGELFHKGRRYAVRGETDYGSTYEVSIVDDSSMNIRKIFDKWLKHIDNSAPRNSGLFGASYESGTNELLDIIKSGVDVANKVKRTVNDPTLASDFILGGLDPSLEGAFNDYQTDINIWQLSSNNEKIYGYKLQNAFPSQIGIVTLDDGDENTLSEFSIQFSFSEFIPLEGIKTNIINTLIGTTGQDVLSGINSLTQQ